MRNSLYKLFQNEVAQNALLSKMDPRDTANALMTAPNQGAAGFGANFLPVVGDAVGLAQDAAMYYADPSSRTWGNGLLSLAGLLPLIPAPGALKRGLKGDLGYMYHATNTDRLNEIAESGKLNVHKPWDFTEQDMWPDGGVDKRAYFGSSPEFLDSFAPSEGAPAVLRVKQDAAKFAKESYTGDFFTQKPILSKFIEYLGNDGSWHPLVKAKK